ncbi:MAG: TIGR02206 family membrane protein [Gammaproteobacteria bacterium]|nr:MAG: TIGR02206 family membrane protein [Gammaproteobacteria bacterium]
MEPQPFIILGTSHLVTLAIILCLAIFFPRNYRDKPVSQKENIAKILGISIIALELVKPFIWHSMDYPWIRLIPIHLCSLSGFFIGIFLLTKKRLFFEIAFFWGIGGGINALITPDVTLTFPDPKYVLFFLGHGLLIVNIGYACIALSNRPTFKSVKNGIFFSLAVLPVIYIINLLLGPPANYWYLGAKPTEGQSIMDFFPDPPLHIPLLIIIGAFLFFLIYSPYWVYDKFKKPNAE